MNLPDRATIQADLAERFSVPCDESLCEARAEVVDGQWVQTNCKLCQDSGLRFPFRAECGKCKASGKIKACPDCHEHTAIMQAHTRPDKKYACDQLGCVNGYRFAVNLDTFCAAFRAKGWRLSITTGLDSQGDYVSISKRDFDKLVQLATVSYKDGLTGMAALEAVAWRADNRG